MRRRGFIHRLRHWLFQAAVTLRPARRPVDAEPVDWWMQTNRSGLRFTQRVRDYWRRRWLRITPDQDGPS